MSGIDVPRPRGVTSRITNARESSTRVSVFLGSEQLFSFTLEEGFCEIGRSHRADIVLPLPEVSRLHAVLERRGTSLSIEDRSRNGLMINGVRLQSSKLAPGDEVRIAAYRLKFGPDDTEGSERSGSELGSRLETLSAATVLSTGRFGTAGLEPAGRAVENLGEMIGASESMRKVYAQVRRLAGRPEPVLIHGETGTGKELVARALHHLGPTRGGPLVTVNCAAIAPELVETELFGHEKGAYTGASHRRLGAFVGAQGGTLFLDEIGEMPLPLQPKLLRALESGEVTPVGGEKPIKITARIIAATNRTLKRDVATGRFRGDLYYRLRVVTIFLPPLRERGEDALTLACHFLAEEGAGKHVEFTHDALALLRSYRWAGNVRELRNLIRRLIAEGVDSPVQASVLEEALEIDRELDEQSLAWMSRHSLPGSRSASGISGSASAARGGNLRDVRHDIEGRIIQRTLEACRWNLSEASRRLGISRGTLYKLISTHHLQRHPVI